MSDEPVQNQNVFGPPRPVGYVGLAGAPNVGKSTLLNRLVGQKISIVSDRPQTTRQQICGIYTDERVQAILVDIPGILAHNDPFNRALVECAEQGLAGCDIVLHLRDVRHAVDPADEPVVDMLKRCGKPIWLVWNKIDKRTDRTPPPMPADLPYQEVYALSARTGVGVDVLLAGLARVLPVGPLLFDPEQLSDRDLRYMAGELVREKLFRYLGQEVPYGTATEVEQFDESREKAHIKVVILTEREAHKAIIIGQGGQMLKKIGSAARVDIEQLIGRPVFLELWVKVKPAWRKDENQLKRLGLKQPRKR
ncbi:MAG: GTPase Era [Candidatus Sumerlaeia bacterium]